MNFEFNNIVVIAPHPDDETIALGGSLARFVNSGCNVSVLIISGHLPPLYTQEAFEITRAESKEAFKALGITDYEFSEIPATYVHQRPVAEINRLISCFVKSRRPDTVFIPYPDRHIDHRTIFDASVVACRPVGDFPPKFVFSYETLSETHWNVPGIEPSFSPEVFIDISDFITTKKAALSSYISQLSNNDSRSIEACEALARFRGSQNGCKYAEAFKIVRMVL